MIKQQSRGFSVVELILAITIMGVFAVVGGRVLSGAREASVEQRALILGQHMDAALSEFRLTAVDPVARWAAAENDAERYQLLRPFLGPMAPHNLEDFFSENGIAFSLPETIQSLTRTQIEIGQ